MKTVSNKHFTLLELLVVISLLVILASSFALSFNTEKIHEKVAQREMMLIAQALKQYETDNDTYPPMKSSPGVNEFSIRDFTPLFEGNSTWKPKYRKGWNGPYINPIRAIDVEGEKHLMIDQKNFIFNFTSKTLSIAHFPKKLNIETMTFTEK